jgi:hypothetical protein
MAKEGLDMKVAELLSMLEGVDPETELRLATQPSYPMEHSIMGVTDVVDATHPYTQAVEKVVYLLEGTQLGYASRELWNI